MTPQGIWARASLGAGGAVIGLAFLIKPTISFSAKAGPATHEARSAISEGGLAHWQMNHAPLKKEQDALGWIIPFGPR